MYKANENFTKPQVQEVDEVGKRLLRAVEIIQQRGWCQGTQMDSDGRVCVVGAIFADTANGDVDQFWEAEQRLSAYVEKLNQPVTRNTGVVYAARWNDHPSRTKEQVIAALRAAASYR